jgi:hypothetical protein
MMQDTTKAKFHLSNGLCFKINYILIEDLFPVVWSNKGSNLHCQIQEIG